MRIISQDGKFDLPYEQCGMQILQKYRTTSIGKIPDGFSIRAYLQTNSGSFCMANYTTEEMAIKTMEMLRDQYDYIEQYKHMGDMVIRKKLVFYFPQDDKGENS